ncbi:phytoene/squalene synthase family protein [Rothia endophytica]|uniref:phytoene/squalene synthase family protein n=1 Tax=Rothia endophytica TaxID=1324766 RepID=UPI001F1AD640|nr:phytoene/squalene synthase family protein [Rothia endophytica]
MNHTDRLGLYSLAARRSSYPVIGVYSSSFRLASLIYPSAMRASIACIYALVRVADEIVDGTAADAGLTVDQQRQALDVLEREVEFALSTGFSSNLVVHAFAREARACGITADLTRPFFESMRMDLDEVNFDTDEQYHRYIYGSAEVIGLMCLCIFLKDNPCPPPQRQELEGAARALGAAFQKINFLRDYADDSTRLGRNYFPHVEGKLNEDSLGVIIADIEQDLAHARSGIDALPRRARYAVRSATALYKHLLEQLQAASVRDIERRRFSLSTPTKLRLIGKELMPLSKATL